MHSLVYVIVPSLIKDFYNEIERLLAGSEQTPDKIYQKYEKPCFCIGFRAHADSYENFDKSVEGIHLKNTLEDARLYNNRKIVEEILLKRFRKVQELELDHPEYGKTDPDCDVCNGTGFYLTDRDPNGKWDWWTIGGRWSGLFKDFAYSKSIQDSKLRGNVSPVKNVLTKEAPAAIVTPEGEWYEGPIVLEEDKLFEDERSEEELNERENWKQKAEEILHKYVTYLVVVVDCHF